MLMLASTSNQLASLLTHVEGDALTDEDNQSCGEWEVPLTHIGGGV